MNFYYILYFSKKGGRREEAAEALQIHTRVTTVTQTVLYNRLQCGSQQLFLLVFS